MKNIINKTYILFFLINILGESKAQLPLNYGDAVITHSPTKQLSTGSSNLGIVVRVIKTANTSTAPFGPGSSNWNISPFGTKPVNWTAPQGRWSVDSLGTVFGITLDDNFNPNIYVSSTQIYNAGASFERKIWKLNNTTGSRSLVYDFGNAGRSLGNLKYVRIGGVENIYVSDWQTGQIQRVTGNSVGISTWSLKQPFQPMFPDSDTLTKPYVNMAYGLGVRNVGGGNYRLYYARISTFPNSNLAGAYGNNEIYSIGLNGSGNFTGTEQKEKINVILNKDRAKWDGYTSQTNPPDLDITCTILPVIADLAFTSDGAKMLIGQQSWQSFGSIAPHNSGVYEIKFNLSTGQWDNSGDLFPSGGSIFGLNCVNTSASTNFNCTGGISYSNNILRKDSGYSCDTTVWFSTDYNANYVYGIQGMRSDGGNVDNSIRIDADDDLAFYDKNHLGDVEVYKKPMQCITCACGKWLTTPSLNGEPIPGVPLMYQDAAEVSLLRNKQEAGNKLKPPTTIPPGDYNSNEAPLLKNYPVQFVQGNISGLINAQYECRGCKDSAAFAWSITKNGATTPILTGTALPVILENYNNQLKCGKYILIIKASCGGNSCDSYTIPITIICEPVSCCKAVINIGLVKSDIHALPNINTSSGFSTANLSYNINYDVPMTEIRVSVEEFRLTANSANCLNCSNRPVTWGNILRATLNGNAMTLTSATAAQPPIPTPPSNSLQADYREAVYSTGSLINPPSAALFLMLSLPQVTELSCCEVSAYVCLKFTFKDAQCRECVQMVCGNIKLIPPAPTGTPGNPQSISNKTTIDTKIFNIGH